MWDTTYIAYGVRDTNFTVSTSTQTSIEAHGNHDFSMEVLVSDPDGDPFVDTLSPEDQQKLADFGLHLVYENDTFHLKTSEDGINYGNLLTDTLPTLATFELIIDDGKKNGRTTYTHSLTIHPNYFPTIIIPNVNYSFKPDEPDTLYRLIDDIHDIEIFLEDKNGDSIITIIDTVDMPEHFILVEEYHDYYNYEFKSVEVQNSFLTVSAYDTCGAMTVQSYVVIVVPKVYDNKVLPFKFDVFYESKDTISLSVNENEVLHDDGGYKLELKEGDFSKNTNLGWIFYDRFIFESRYLDTISFKAISIENNTGEEYSGLSWFITVCKGGDTPNGFPYPHNSDLRKDYFFHNDSRGYNAKFNLEKPEQKWWPLVEGNTIKIKTSGFVNEY